MAKESGFDAAQKIYDSRKDLFEFRDESPLVLRPLQSGLSPYRHGATRSRLAGRMLRPAHQWFCGLFDLAAAAIENSSPLQQPVLHPQWDKSGIEITHVGLLEQRSRPVHPAKSHKCSDPSARIVGAGVHSQTRMSLLYSPPAGSRSTLSYRQ
jgi:hypothetical protein